MFDPLLKKIDRCYFTGKVRFDKRGAQTAKNLRWKEDHIELRIYPCPNCRSWHLTSVIKKKYE